MSERPRRRSAPRAASPGTKRPNPATINPSASVGEASPPGGGGGPASERRLETILRHLPEAELEALASRVGIKLDSRKRIDKPAQMARGLVRLPDVREPGRLPAPSGELLQRIAEAGGSLLVGAVPSGLEWLARRGLVFARLAGEATAQEFRERFGAGPGGHVYELVLPTAFLVQMKPGDGDDPRSLRVLLAEAPPETLQAIATHYLGRPSTPPVELSLEPAWEVLGDSARLAEELARVSHQERRLLEQLEQVGGEADTQELMDLEREPMRLRGAYGVAAGRRGAAFSLEKRGFLFPIHPNRYVLPTEIARLVGADRIQEREQRRERIRCHVVEEDHLPRRARFSGDPAMLAIALALAVRESGQASDARPPGGTPRSMLSRLAQRFGKTHEETALVVALSRAMGLWDPGATLAAAPPGHLRLDRVSEELFATWRRGGAWDEARSEAETLRLPAGMRDSSPVMVLRDVVLDALVDLSEGQWAPYPELVAYIEADPRMGGAHRLLERWAKRVGVELPTEVAIVRRMLLESLPSLGVLDVGGAGSDAPMQAKPAGLAIRLTNRGRRLAASTSLTGATPAGREIPSEFVGERRLRIGTAARVAHVLELAPFVDVSGIDPAVEVTLSPASVGRGLALGLDAAEMRRRLALVAPPPAELVGWLDEAATVVGSGTFAAAGGFVWIDDPDVREFLRTRPGFGDVFIDPSPAGGLLVATGLEPERLARRCRAVGIELTMDERGVRARRSSAPPPPPQEPSRKTSAWRPPPLPRIDLDD